MNDVTELIFSVSYKLIYSISFGKVVLVMCHSWFSHNPPNTLYPTHYTTLNSTVNLIIKIIDTWVTYDLFNIKVYFDYKSKYNNSF